MTVRQALTADGAAGRMLPILRWLPFYQRAWLLPDVLAGLAVWAVMAPEGMAYAGIVGVPPIMGLYTIVPPLIAYGLLGTSRLLVVGPDTATGLISALTVGAIAVQGTSAFNSLTSTLAILIGTLFLVFGLIRMGWVASFIPTPVMRGFIEGLVCVTIIGQVPHLLGIEGSSGDFFTKLWSILRHLPDVAPAPVLTGLFSLIAMLALRHLAPRIPAALVVAAGSTILVSLFHGEAADVSVVGDLPSGLPDLTIPIFDPAVLLELLPGALAIVLVGYAEALGGAKAAAMQDGSSIDPNQELVAHGPANILSGLFGGFLVVGSLSKTSVAMAAGARTQLANLVAAVFCFLTLVFLTPLFRGMPHPALAAIVIAAMLHLSKPGYLRVLFAQSRWEFAIAAIVVAGELTLGVLHGIALGVGLSLLQLIYRGEPSAWRRAGSVTGHGSISLCRASSRGPDLPRAADLAPRRRSVLCQYWSFRGRPERCIGGESSSCAPCASRCRIRQLHRRQRRRRARDLPEKAAKRWGHGRLCSRPRQRARADADGRHRRCRSLGRLP